MDSIKMIFCKHEYHLYNVCNRFSLFHMIDCNSFNFVCTKCGKATNLLSLNIEYDINYIEDYVRKQIALGNQLNEYNEECFLKMKKYEQDVLKKYEGKHIDILMKGYKKKHNIDLSEISHWYDEGKV